MARKFFRGANAGYIGSTREGKAIRNYFMVKMETGKRSRFFQVKECRGIKFCGTWIEVKPSEKVFRLNEDGDFQTKIVWRFKGKELSCDELELKYEIVELTSLIDEVSKLYILDNLVHSPYVNVVKCLEICYAKDEISKEKKEDKFLIEAIEDYIREKREDRKREFKL